MKSPLIVSKPKPRNPWALPARLRKAGRHRSGPTRQDGQRELQRMLRPMDGIPP